MTAILLFLKHRVPALWRVVEWWNAVLFAVLHRRRFRVESLRSLEEFGLEPYTFRSLGQVDVAALRRLIGRQSPERLDYFKPHGFDEASLLRTQRNPSFLMFGAFDGAELVGYFFLRCFWNRRCFVGRLIDEPYEGRGIGRVMNQIMYNTSWRARFRCMTTVSKRNPKVMRSHANNPAARVVRALPNDYVLMEFVHPEAASGQSTLGHGRDGTRA